MPNRIIKESAFTSDKISQLTDFEFRLWVGLITQADDAGRGDARPAIIKGRIFALRERTAIKDIDNALRALAAHGCVVLYTVDGKPYYEFPNWTAHQRVRNALPKYPGFDEKDPENDASPQLAANGGNSPQLAANGGLNPIQSNPIRIQSESNPNITTSDEVVCRTRDVRRIVERWNTLGLAQVKGISPSSARSGLLRARIKEHGIDGVLQAIEMIRQSEFLRGQNKNGWTATFDWFLKPGNFQKVIEGNYRETRTEGSSNPFLDMLREDGYDVGTD